MMRRISMEFSVQYGDSVFERDREGKETDQTLTTWAKKNPEICMIIIQKLLFCMAIPAEIPNK
jgi:hypothetical protein